MVRAHVFLLVLFLALAQPLLGQAGLVREEMLWSSFDQHIALSKRWEAKLEWHHRVMSTGLQHWLAPRVRIGVRLHERLTLDVGFLHFGVVRNTDGEWREQSLQTEFRPHQALILDTPIRNIDIQQRFMVEQRMFRKVIEGRTVPGRDFFWRFRYKISLATPLAVWNGIAVNALLSEEILLNAGHSLTKRAFDQNRIFVGIAFEFNPHLTTKIGYLHWLQQPITADHLLIRNTLRVGVVHSFGVKAN